MKKKCLTSILLSAVLLFSFLLGGCFDSDAAKKSADVFCSLVFKSDAENLDKVGVSQSQKDQLVDEYHSQIRKQLQDNISMWGGYVSQSQLDEICDAYTDALSNITFEVKQISKSGDSAEVEVSTTHFDARKADEQAIMEAMDELENVKFESEYDEDNKLTETYLNKLPEKLRNSVISSEKSTNTFKFKKVDKYWVPEDEENFGYMLVQQATNDENLSLAIDDARITPAESAEIFWNITAKAEASGIEKLGYSKEFGDKLVSYSSKKVAQQMKDEFSEMGASLSDDEVQNLVQAFINGLSKNTAQYEEISKDDDTAKVKITSTSLDFSSIVEAAVNKTTNDAIASGNSDTQQLMQAYCTNLINEINNAQPVSRPTNQITIDFTKVADLWLPSNMDDFAEDISSMCIE